MTVLPLDYPNRPTLAEAARDDRDHPLTGPSRFLTGPYRCVDPWCPRAGSGEHWHGQDRGSASVALFLAACIAGALLFLAAVAGGQHAMCAVHDDALRYCPGYAATPTQETSR